MSTITVETECGKRQWYDDRREAEASKRRHRARCETCEDADVRLVADPDQATLRTVAERERADERRADGSGATTERPAESAEPAAPDGPSSALDPSSQDRSDATEDASTPTDAGASEPTAVRDVAVRAEAITTAGETDHEYAEFRATAWRKDEGPEQGYTGHGTARAAEDRPGIEHRLNEVAETRAMERALAWAVGTRPAPLDAAPDGEEA